MYLFSHVAQEANDAACIAGLKYNWLKPGQYYSKRDSKDVFRFAGLTAENAEFIVRDMYGKEQAVLVQHADLFRFRATDKKPASMLDEELVSKLQPEKCLQWQLELEKAQVQACLLENHNEHLGCILVAIISGLGSLGL